jgi:alpha-glucoside transport system substrate-binding protein
MRTAITRLARVLLGLGLCAVPVACGATVGSNSTVTILVPWEVNSNEYSAFKDVIKPFADNNGIDVTLQVTRGVSQQLDADIAAHDPPDLADLPSPGAVYNYRHNGLQPLQMISLRNYAEPWRGLAMLGSGEVYAVPVKADVQSLIWYPTTAVKKPPADWATLVSDSKLPGTPWCLGLASGAVSGWPGTDWIADIFLSNYQASAYKNWLNGTLAWNSTQVRYAWHEWGTLLRNGSAIYGSPAMALTTPFNQALAHHPCVLEHGALATTGLTSTDGYDFVPFPAVSGGPSPTLVSGDFMGLFTRNPDAIKLLAYLATDKAQTLWVRQPHGSAFSADKKVSPTSYRSSLARGWPRTRRLS